MSEDPISMAFIILAVILAVIAGLWFGTVLGESTTKKNKDGTQGPRRTLGKTLQAAATTSVVRLWQWQRARAKKQREDGQKQ
jgi:hypothetical protein